MADNSKKTQVTELQRMLRAVSYIHTDVPRINPDGVFGRETTEALRIFQRQMGLAPTGTADFATWNALRAESALARDSAAGGKSVSVFPNAGYVAKPGEKSSLVYVIQIILNDISHTYDGLEDVEVTGTYDKATYEGVKLFQYYHRIEETGNVDKKTWDALAASYNVFANNENYIS